MVSPRRTSRRKGGTRATTHPATHTRLASWWSATACPIWKTSAYPLRPAVSPSTTSPTPTTAVSRGPRSPPWSTWLASRSPTPCTPRACMPTWPNRSPACAAGVPSAPHLHVGLLLPQPLGSALRPVPLSSHPCSCTYRSPSCQTPRRPPCPCIATLTPPSSSSTTALYCPPTWPSVSVMGLEALSFTPLAWAPSCASGTASAYGPPPRVWSGRSASSPYTSYRGGTDAWCHPRTAPRPFSMATPDPRPNLPSLTLLCLRQHWELWVQAQHDTLAQHLLALLNTASLPIRPPHPPRGPYLFRISSKGPYLGALLLEPQLGLDHAYEDATAATYYAGRRSHLWRHDGAIFCDLLATDALSTCAIKRAFAYRTLEW